MGLFSRKKKDGPSKVKKGAQDAGNVAAKPLWDDAWTRTTVDPDEIQELCRGCTLELKSRALDTPFLLLPFRPTSDPSAARTFIRRFFDKGQRLYGATLEQELRLTEPMVLCSVVKWCWSRLAGGVVGWEAYELFKVGEQDSNMARDSFATFIPLSVDSDSRTHIIFDFFDLLAAIAAHSKTNGLGGRKLSRMAGWWAFEHPDTGNGFEGGYKGWASAADATSHLFFAYLRSLSPDSVKGLNGISTLPMSLQKLLQETEYPPERPSLMQSTTTKVVMIVNSVSPTPFALLRRTNNFQYRDDDRALQEFSEYEDPVKALTEECRRVLRSISTANQSQASSSKQSTGVQEASWSRFEDLGFSGGFDDDEDEDGENIVKKRNPQGLRTTPHTRTAAGGRPTTPSWADFLSSGFVDENGSNPAPLLLPPDKILPPIDTSRGRSSQSHKPRLESNKDLEPGELASITRFDLDDAFWWVWISSLAGEESSERKAAFGRCALVETIISGGRWLVMEEIIQGAAPSPDPGAYIAEKKSRFGWTKRNKGVTRSKSMGKPTLEPPMNGRPPFATSQSQGVSKTSIGPDQHARIQAAAMQLQQRQRQQDAQQDLALRRGRNQTDAMSQKTSSVFTLQPVIMNEASPAMKWANKYDKDAIREAYLANNQSGRGLGEATMQTNGRPSSRSRERELPTIPSSSAASEAGPSTAGLATPAAPAAPFPPTPNLDDNQERDFALSEKAAELPLPSETHPIARKPVGASSPLASPMHPVDNKISSDVPREPSTEIHSGSSPENKTKHNKLKKEKPAGGFRKMFGRKKTAPPSAASPEPPLNGGQLQAGGATLGRRFSGFKKKSPLSSPTIEQEPQQPPPPPHSDDGDNTPIASPRQPYDMSYDPSVRDSLSRVDTHDAHEAREEFSRFDQGPMDDVPAFVPDESPRHSDEVITPPISRADDDYDESPDQASPVQDRWAQIRKNAAERAAQRQSEEQSRGGYSQKTDGDDGETSGEETIESRVARIKARVAELTGNMEQGAPAPGPIRR
ncbi:morphogenesis protein [Phlyctema vagabunda]|uniref:Morphogenesis protein n=1 Tax=Phlyctema vagabunda TaxID=108571 RepID=A0ABR4PR02_9HELO